MNEDSVFDFDEYILEVEKYDPLPIIFNQIIRDSKKRKRKKKMNEIIIPGQQNSELAIKNQEINSFIQKNASDLSIIPYIKIISGMSVEMSDPNLGLKVGDIFVPPDLNLGQKVRVLILPWRYKAMTIENGKVTRVDFNLTDRSSYDPKTNSWNCPDGITKTFEDIAKGPSDGSTILNDAGYELLLYIPEKGICVTLWLKKTAISMSKAFPTAQANLGRQAWLFTRIASSSKFKWPLPHLEIIEKKDETEINPNPIIQETIEQFLHPGVISISSTDVTEEKPR